MVKVVRKKKKPTNGFSSLKSSRTSRVQKRKNKRAKRK